MPNPSPDLLLRALRQVRLFSALPEPLLDRLVPFCGVRTIRRGESIFLQGEPSPYCFGVLKGSVEVYRVTRDRQGPTKRLGEFGPGEFFGESSLFLDTPRTATGTATDDGELITLTGSKLREWMYANPTHSLPLIMSVLQNSLERLHGTSQELAVVYGMERLLASAQPFDQTLPQALHFLEQAFSAIDTVQLYERSMALDEFALVNARDGETVEPIAFQHPFAVRMTESEGAALLTRTELDAWKVRDRIAHGKCESAIAVSLWDRDQSPRILEGFLILASAEASVPFGAEDLRLLTAVASPLAEALLRNRRQQDAKDRDRLHRSRQNYPK